MSSGSNWSASVLSMEAQVQPVRESLARLLAHRSEFERYLTLQERVDELEALCKAVELETLATAEPVRDGISSRARRDVLAALRRILTDWEVPGSGDTTVDFDGAPEIVLEHRRRADRGKGMRAILHAGFSVTLSEYCLENDRPHLGWLPWTPRF